MLPEVDIFVGNYTIIDQEIYDLWIKGFSVNECVSELQNRGVMEKWDVTVEIVTADVSDQYRTFGMLEKLLPTPVRLVEERMFQIAPSMQKLVIEKYYNFDGPVIREIIGKKLSGRTRKELDDVSSKTGVSLRSCRRQFDNVKYIFKQVDDSPGLVVNNIQSMFLLPLRLAREYASIVFLMTHRFEAFKKRLNYLKFEDFSVCAASMVNHWTFIGKEGAQMEQNDQSDLDREFLKGLKDLKVILEREKEHRNVTLSHLRGRIPDRMCSELESNFKSYSRSLICVATGLNNMRDLRDFFVDVVEKFIEPCRQGRWKEEEIATFLKVYKETGASLDLMDNDKQLKRTWDRYMRVMQICITQLYHT